MFRALTFNDTFGDGITRDVGPRLEECVVEDHDAANKIAVIRVEGIITDQGIDRAGNSMVDVIRAQLNRAKKDNRVKAVILKVNSPGGEVLAADEIKKAVARFQEDSGKPVICSMGSLAASGGYYISAPSRWIVANPMTITGSIGVILQHVELSRVDGQGGPRAGDLQERQVQGHAKRRTQHE